MIPDIGGVIILVLMFGAAMAAPPIIMGPLGGAVLGGLHPDRGIFKGFWLGAGLGLIGTLVSLIFNAQWVEFYPWNSPWGLLAFAILPAITSIWSVAITKAVLCGMRPGWGSDRVTWLFWLGVAVFTAGAIGLPYGWLNDNSLEKPFLSMPALVLVLVVGALLVWIGIRKTETVPSQGGRSWVMYAAVLGVVMLLAGGGCLVLNMTTDVLATDAPFFSWFSRWPFLAMVVVLGGILAMYATREQ